ncbi:hypothetical protein HAV_01143 [Candidatus Hepatincola sp. Av]
MIIFEFSKNFYRNLYLLLVLVLLLGVITTTYFYNRHVFDITNIQMQLDSSTAKVFRGKISWSYKNSQLIGETSLNNNKLKITYHLSRKNIGYSLVESDSYSSIQLPCLNILHVLPTSMVKLIYQKFLAKNRDYTVSQNIEIKRGLYVGYTYLKQQEVVFTTCNVYYK